MYSRLTHRITSTTQQNHEGMYELDECGDKCDELSDEGVPGIVLTQMFLNVRKYSNVRAWSLHLNSQRNILPQAICCCFFMPCLMYACQL